MAFRFIFLADCQLGCYATFSGLTEHDVVEYARRGMKVRVVPRVEGFEWDAARYRRALEIASVLEPAFVAVGGDMVDDLADLDQRRELLRITALLDPSVEVRWVPGNHDVCFDALTPTPESLATYRDVFGEDVYAFGVEEASFVVVNTTVMTAPEAVPDEYEAQFAFLERALEEASRVGGPVIVLGHHPFFLSHPSEPDSFWNVPLPARRRALDLFHRHGVSTVFAGHWHRNHIGWDGDLEMVTSGPVGYPLGDDPSGYRLVEVRDGKVTHAYHALDEGPLPDVPA